jgi:hypothetical protein
MPTVSKRKIRLSFQGFKSKIHLKGSGKPGLAEASLLLTTFQWYADCLQKENTVIAVWFQVKNSTPGIVIDDLRRKFRVRSGQSFFQFDLEKLVNPLFSNLAGFRSHDGAVLLKGVAHTTAAAEIDQLAIPAFIKIQWSPETGLLDLLDL